MKIESEREERVNLKRGVSLSVESAMSDYI